ncbi:MAG: hypothetical protein HYS08_03925 [Chlamydiae bacterium]|nr:hypothetical protein [Chlamydiota bacterium]MBI3266808.1 hypothetical protein [Chlamydiota bacterium]
MEGMVTRKVEVRGMGAFSIFRICFAVTLIFSLVSFILVNLFGMQLTGYIAGTIGDIRIFISNLETHFPHLFQNEIVLSLMAALGIGLGVGFMTAFFSFVFSIFATLLGGIKITIREKNVEKKTAYL